MKILRTIEKDSLENLLKKKKLLLKNENLKVIEITKNNFKVYPKYLTSFPFHSEKKSTLNYYYNIFFKEEELIINYMLNTRMFYSFAVLISGIMISCIVFVFNPKIIGLLLIFALSFICLTFIALMTFLKAKRFIINELGLLGSVVK